MIEAEEEEMLYDERIAARRLAFRNAVPHPERLILSSESGGGAHAWLVGSIYLLVPAVFDIHYWKSRVGLGGMNTRRERRTLPSLHDCLNMVVQVEFLDSGQLSYRSQLIAPKALEEWRNAQGDPSRLNPRRILTSLSEGVSRWWWSDWKKKAEIDPEAAVIQDTLTVTMPMGPYRGSDERLILHQSGLDRVALLDPVSLRVRHHISYTDLNRFFHGIPCPKPLYDMSSNEMINVMCEKGRKMFRYSIVALSTTVTTFQDVPHVGHVVASFLAPPTKLDSFAITQRFVIIAIDSKRYKKQPRYDSCIVDGVEEFLEFDEKADTLFYVVARGAGQLVAVFRSEPSNILQIVNAFENDHDTIFIDVVATESPEPPATVESLRNRDLSELSREVPESGTLRRYCIFRLGEEMARFDGAAGQLPSFPLVPFHHLTDYPLHSPTIAPFHVGKPYRYVYARGVDRDNRGRAGFMPNALIKCDLVTRSKSMQWTRHGFYCGPPVFIPNSIPTYSGGALNEDDGVLVTVALDVPGSRSYVVVLEGRDLREVCRFAAPRPLPIGNATPVWIPNRAASIMRSIPEPPENTALLATTKQQ